MAVVTSTFILGHVQHDGRRWVHEAHTLHNAVEMVFAYLADMASDYAAIMAARLPEIAEMLAEQESRDNLDRDDAPTLVEQTAAAFRTRMREAFRHADRERACYLSWWLLRRIAAGHITDTQARGVFGMTTTQWATFKTNKLQPRSDAWAAVLAATGE